MPVGPDLAKSQDIIRIRKKRKKHSGRKALLIVVAVIVCVFGVVGGAAALYFNSINQALSFEDKETIESLKSVLEPVVVDDEKGEQPYYVLVLGSDAREGDTASRSDVIILTRVDPSNGLITMVSIPRDTMVELEGYGRQKINAAYAYGGAAGAVEAVSAFAGVPISHYAEIHFEELEELVDMLGGVWVDVPVTNDETGSSNSGMHIEAGEQLLNGEQALAFARERYGYVRGDFQRADNQRILAEAIVKKVLSSSPIDLPGTIQKLAGCVSTDYDLTAIIDLARQFQSTSTTFYSALAPSSTMTLDGVSYVVVDPTDWAAMMERVDAGEDPTAVEADAPVSDEAPAEGESPGAEAGSA
ncbi:transcriptional regulator [Gordonibacter sp. An230]|nr:transcriptional regulator [Gordonibacter sp. An230]